MNQDSGPADYQRRVALLLEILAEQAFRKAKAHPEISAQEFAAMRLIGQFGSIGITASGIARALGMRYATSATLVARLEQRGHIASELLPNAKRRRLHRLTEAGWDLLCNHDPFSRIVDELLAQASTDERRLIFQIFFRLDAAQQRWRDLRLGAEAWR